MKQPLYSLVLFFLVGTTLWANPQRVENSLTRTFLYQNEPDSLYSLSQRMEYYKIPGVSIAIIENGSVVWAKAYGVTNSITNESVTLETQFQAASLSKMVTAMVTLSMEQDGVLDMAESCNKALKKWQLKSSNSLLKEQVDSITSVDLLSHRGGVNVSGFAGYAAGKSVPSLSAVLEGRGNSDPITVIAPPKKDWSYSGGGYTVLQQLLEEKGKNSFDSLAYDRILTPLKMKSSSFRQDRARLQKENIANGHKRGVLLKGGWHTYPELAAAGLWTTPTDYAKLLISIQNSVVHKKGVLSSSSAQKLLTPFHPFYGLGVFLKEQGEHSYFYHSGINEGFESYFVAYKQGGKGAVIMTNGSGGEELAKEVLRSVATVYNWSSYEKERPTFHRLTFSEQQGLSGTYQFATGNQLFIRMREGKLFLQNSGYPSYAMEALDKDSLLVVAYEGELKVERNSEGAVVAIQQKYNGEWYRAVKVN